MRFFSEEAWREIFGEDPDDFYRKPEQELDFD